MGMTPRERECCFISWAPSSPASEVSEGGRELLQERQELGVQGVLGQLLHLRQRQAKRVQLGRTGALAAAVASNVARNMCDALSRLQCMQRS
jgi:hypothetical protein